MCVCMCVFVAMCMCMCMCITPTIAYMYTRHRYVRTHTLQRIRTTKTSCRCTVRGCTVYRNEYFCVVDNPEYEKQAGTAGQRNQNSLKTLFKNFTAFPGKDQAIYSYLRNLDMKPRRYAMFLSTYLFLSCLLTCSSFFFYSEAEATGMFRMAEELRGKKEWDLYWKSHGAKHQVVHICIHVYV